MAAGCCGVKKRNLSSSPPYNSGGEDTCISEIQCHTEEMSLGGSGVLINGLREQVEGDTNLTPQNLVEETVQGHQEDGGKSDSPGAPKMIVSPEMCYFCFDVLYCHLYGYQQPRTPGFTNEP
ncbi:AMME syndrome candidate gene 1 protein-like [Vombatus ursinus]|uniref:AMME syndrome candidate gene 1 protein-like n=1 Tax=Vombatus ursinus TaxID=29139 RepID=UPI000FFD6024|nr:AMME syndrome candidate gene 1 protein-like [Vombatus ursinus]